MHYNTSTYNYMIYHHLIIIHHLSRGQGVATLRFKDIAGGEEETDEPWQRLVR